MYCSCTKVTCSLAVLRAAGHYFIAGSPALLLPMRNRENPLHSNRLPYFCHLVARQVPSPGTVIRQTLQSCGYRHPRKSSDAFVWRLRVWQAPQPASSAARLPLMSAIPPLARGARPTTRVEASRKPIKIEQRDCENWGIG